MAGRVISVRFREMELTVTWGCSVWDELPDALLPSPVWLPEETDEELSGWDWSAPEASVWLVETEEPALDALLFPKISGPTYLITINSAAIIRTREITNPTTCTGWTGAP